MKTIRRPISILLAILMVVGMFTMVPITASAAPPESGSSGSMETGTTVTPSAATWTFKLNSNFSGEWNADTDVVSEQPIELNLTEGDYEFQIVAYEDGNLSSYRGNVQAGSFTENYSQIMYDNGGNAKFHADGGKYTLTYNAGSGVATIAPVYVAQIGETNYKTLEAAFAAAVDGDTITLLADCAGNGIKVTPAGKFANGLTVDFNGHTYTVDGETVGSPGTQTLAFQLLKNNKVTFQNGTIYSEKAKMLVQNYCNLTLDNMVLTLNNTSYNGAYTLSNNNGSTVIKDTTINANPTTGSFAFDVCRGGGSNTYPSVDVTVTGNSVINGNVEVYARNSDPKNGLSLTLESGTMNGDIVVDPTAAAAMAASPDKAEVTKAADFNQAAPADFKWVDNGDGTSSLAAIPYVAQIGTTKYETLAAAIDATQAGDTVKLVADVTEKVIISGKDFTLDLNGFNITSTTKNQPIDARDGTKLVITNTNEDKAENTATQNAIMGPSGGNNNGSLIARGEGTEVVINAGYYYGYNGNKTAIHAINDATIIINDCTVNGAQGIGDTTAGKEGKVFYSGLSNPTKPTATSPGTIIVHGGNFSGRMSDSNWGNYIIDGGTFDRNEVVLNENPVDEQGNRVATASSSMATLPDSPGTLDEAGWLVDGFLPVDNGDGTYTVEGPYAAQIGTTNYATLEDAFADAVDGDTITVLADSAGNGIKVPQGKFSNNGLTVDFDGHKYTIDGDLVGSTGTQTLAFQLLKNNNVTFKNGTIYSEKAKMLVQNYSNLTLDNMTLTLNNTSYDGAYTLSNNNGSAVINDTTINANPTTGSFAFDVCRYSSYPSIDVTVTGNSVINGDVEISASKGQAKDGFSLTLESGTMTGDIVLAASAETAMNAAPEKVSVTKAAGFDQEAPEGYMWVDTATEGVQTIAKAVAQIGTTNYATLEAAFAAAQDGDTITLLSDCAGNGIKVTPAGKFATGLTVDFDGHTYTIDGDLVGSTGTQTLAFQLLKNNKVTFQNGTIYSEKAKMLVQNYCNLTLDNMVLTLNNTSYNGAYTLSNNNGSTVIKDTTINANPTTGSFAFDVCRGGGSNSYPSVDVTVTGDSVINGDVEVYARNSDPKNGLSLTLESGTMNGDIVVDPTAAAAIAAAPEKAEVTKDNNFTQEAPADFKWVDNGDGTSTLVAKNYVAKVGDTKYETLEEAVAAAPAGATVTLLTDIDYSEIYTVRNARDTGDAHSIDLKDLTLDLNDNTISAINGTVTFGGNGATIKNGTFALVPKDTDGSYKDGSYALFVDNVPLGYPTTATVNIEDVVCEGGINLSGVTAELTDVTASTTPTKFYTVWAENGATVTINSGTYTDAQPKGKGNLGVGSADTESVIYVKGGDFNATVRNVYNKTPDGSVQISGGTFTKPVLDKYCAEGFVPKDNGDGTYTVEEEVKDLFVGYGLTLHGDIGLIFYLDPAAAGLTANQVTSVSVDFTCDQYNGNYTASGNDLEKDGNYIKVKYYVPAAYMASDITAYNVKFNNLPVVCDDDTDTYSVQEYAQRIMANPVECGIHPDKADAAVTLMKEMLNYGAKAKAVFEAQMDNPEEAVYDPIPEYTMANVTANDVAEKIIGEATDMSTVHPEPDANFYSPSVVYLSKTTLRMVFLIPTGNGSTCTDEYDGHQGVWYYWAEVTDIPAAELDEQQEFEVNGVEFNYSALDYVKAVLNSNMDATNKALAASLFLYNQAANAYYTV